MKLFSAALSLLACALGGTLACGPSRRPERPKPTGRALIRKVIQPKCVMAIKDQQPKLLGPLVRTVKYCFFSYDTRNYNLQKFNECLTKKGYIDSYDVEIKNAVDECYKEDLRFSFFEMCHGISRHSKDIPTSSSVPGGFDFTRVGSDADLDAKLQNLASEISSKARMYRGRKLRTPLQVITHRTQVVAGTNYLVKLTDANKYKENIVHALIYKSLDGKMTVTNAKQGFKRWDCLEVDTL